MAATILSGDVFAMLPTIRPASVDCCVTSPPYWQLRSYLSKDHPLKPLELGSEKTPAEYVANMVRVFGLVRDCLADHGTVWLNVGDTYSGDRTRQVPDSKWTDVGNSAAMDSKAIGIPAGNLCLIPQRLAIALQDDGWIVRSIIVWHKPAPMPASVSGWMWKRCRVKISPKVIHKQGWGTAANNGREGAIQYSNGGVAGNNSAQWSDCPGCSKCLPHDGYVLRRGSWRPTSSWEPILLLAKSAKYFCDGEAVKQPAAAATVSRDQYTRIIDDPDEQFAVRHDHETVSATANLRDVWTIAAEPLNEKHYAAFPSELVRRCLLAGTSSKGYCPTCGAPWARVVQRIGGPPQGDHNRKRDNAEFSEAANGARMMYGGNLSSIYAEYGMPDNQTIGWRSSCSCTGEPRPGLVLDPFAGSGRAGIVATRLGLNFVGVELNPQYVAMCNRRIVADAPLFNLPESVP